MNSEIFRCFQESKLPTGKYDTYFDAYEELFSKYKNQDITFVEVGIMGGGALEAWKKYFGKGSRIIGIDLNPALKDYLSGQGYEIYIGDQADPKFWEDFFKKVGKIDVLLDDGGHTNIQQWTTLKSVVPHINEGGLVVIEDVHASYMMGFGNPSQLSFVSRAKACIDEVNHRSSRIEERDRRLWKKNDLIEEFNIKQYIHSMHFYESIVAFSIRPKLCRIPKEISFGSLETLPMKESPEDFRYKGIEDPSMAEPIPQPPSSLRSKIKARLKKVWT